MKQYLVLFLAFALITLGSCLKQEDFEYVTFEEQLEIDQHIITDYLDENNITAETDSIYGMRFVIHAPGDTIKPKLTDTILVSYAGRLLKNGAEFDANDSVSFKLNTLIPAWQIGLPYLMQGGEMTIYTPSGFAYGPNYVGEIPPNSCLIFDLTLHRVGGN